MTNLCGTVDLPCRSTPLGTAQSGPTMTVPDVTAGGTRKAAPGATSRYLARDLGAEGIHANLVLVGPVGSMAAKSIPWASKASVDRAAIGWDTTDP